MKHHFFKSAEISPSAQPPVCLANAEKRSSHRLIRVVTYLVQKAHHWHLRQITLRNLIYPWPRILLHSQRGQFSEDHGQGNKGYLPPPCVGTPSWQSRGCHLGGGCTWLWEAITWQVTSMNLQIAEAVPCLSQELSPFLTSHCQVFPQTLHPPQSHTPIAETGRWAIPQPTAKFIFEKVSWTKWRGKVGGSNRMVFFSKTEMSHISVCGGLQS